MGIHFGVDYYPEHWPKERWETDAKLMKEMGLKVVRMAEFSWHKLEPEEGTYDFAWLDETIALLGRYGIKTIVGTPTAAPPAWMANRYPEILPVDREGRVRGFGGRHHDCQSNPVYRGYVRKIVTAMAVHYKDNPDVIGWQPDNELGNSHHDLCMCDSCRKGFQSWLEKKYVTVDRLNEAWGNAFWSQECNSFTEVFAPKITVTGENPSAMLDWKCYCSDLIVDFMKEQTDIIRKYCPNHFITHNYMGFADKVNYYDLGKELDFISHDQYPGGFFADESRGRGDVLASTLDVVRSYKNKNFWIMEQQSGITGWQVMGRSPAPGQLSLWTLQSVAHGADAVVYFRWRVCAMGTEQYWHGILPHSGNPGRRYEELKDTITTVTPLMEEMEGSMPAPEVGIVYSFRQNYALQIQPQNPNMSYIGQIQEYYKAFYDRQIPVDFVPDDGDFAKYKLLVAPLQYLMNPELEERYINYVKNGGHLVLTMRTGVKDDTNLCMTDRELPGRLSEITGSEVLDYDCLRDAKVSVIFQNDDHESHNHTTHNHAVHSYTARNWCDLMKVREGVTILAAYGSEFYAGEPCVTRNEYGNGCCYYIGTEPDSELLAALAGYMADAAGVSSLGSAGDGVELAARETEGKRWLFAMNHAGGERTYAVDDSYRLVYGDHIGRLKEYEVHILEMDI